MTHESSHFLEDTLGSLTTTAGTALPATTPIAPEHMERVRRRFDVDELYEAVLRGDRTQIARAITLLESTAAAHAVLAQQLLVKLLPHSGDALRVGITGVPGVGKSTFIEALGLYLVGQGHKVAVLAIDPSSTRTKGSILGDKTRMAKLSQESNAYIRPSPSAGTLGGVAKATRESMVVMEAAGFDVILIETVGVGQSEVAVHDMVDCFTFLALAGAGDQLQGIKKGVLELADLVAINKADGDNVRKAKKAARELSAALRMVRQPDAVWLPTTMTMSAATNENVDVFWEKILKHNAAMKKAGRFEPQRRQQQVGWMWQMVHETLLSRLNNSPEVLTARTKVEEELKAGEITPTLAAQEIVDAFDSTTR